LSSLVAVPIFASSCIMSWYRVSQVKCSTGESHD
jgi:hypothetical protein